jgi:glycosyltransferase involved in cell wall biosynthesis
MGAKRQSVNGFTVWDHGVTAPSRDFVAFSRGLQFLIDRPQLRQEMGDRGQHFVQTRLSKDRLIGDIERLYRELA